VDQIWNPAYIDTALEGRAVTFENPTGARAAGGQAHGGRKGAPSREIGPGERVRLADIEGPGTLRHLWMTFPSARPERMRALVLEVFYDHRDEPSVSVPCLDFFGLPHGRPVAYHSALMAAQEGRGFNSYLPMPFGGRLRMEVINHGPRPVTFYYQADYTLEPERTESYLHVAFRRQNPTLQREDFVITEGLEGPGRFLGCNVGVRVIDPCDWYGEGEVKMYLDGDTDLPTICGTGLEDYAGSAWGLGAHAAPYSGAPLVVGPSEGAEMLHEGWGNRVELTGFYRWHLPDPVMFSRDLRVTIQQIGAAFFRTGEEERMAAYEPTNPPAGAGWIRSSNFPDMLAWGICERSDDYCATSYVYCRGPQAVPRVDPTAATADIARRPYESTRPALGMPGLA